MLNNILDSINCGLSGVNVIEASAGTGKTYNIQNLFARMILEQAVPVSEILVVTYTEAATKELRDRIRRILHELELCLSCGHSSDDRVRTLAARLKPDSEESINRYLTRIRTAIRDFDEASVFTIHGFCRRMLNDNAFESGILFNIELEQNPQAVIQEIVEEFWRKTFYAPGASVIRLCAAEYCNLSVSSLYTFVSNMQNRHGAEFKTGFEGEGDSDDDELKVDPEGAMKKMIRLWERPLIEKQLTDAMLSSDKKFSYNISARNKVCDAMDAVANGVIDTDAISLLKAFSRESITRAKLSKSDLSVITHPFFDAADEFFRQLGAYKIKLRLDCLKHFGGEYYKRKQAQNFQTFNDLLVNLDHRINYENDRRLLDAIRSKFKAAMIDEFQDTDQIQYRIFKKIFIDGGLPIFMVGDPKQAIYGFRGGDIFTYIAARNEARERKGAEYSLSRNWRSTPAMVESINQLFGRLPDPFLNERITFQPGTGADEPFDPLTQLAVNGMPDSEPLKVIRVDADHEITNGTDMTQACCGMTSMKILDMLNDNSLSVPDGSGAVRKLLPRDFAILVNSHFQARELQPYLRELNIPCVLQNTGSVFDSSEAEQLELFLRAVADCKNLRLVRGALTVDMIALDAAAMAAENDSRIDYWLEFFRTLNRIWETESFIEMFNSFMNQADVRGKLLGQINGERKLCNTLHLAELLHQYEASGQLGVFGLINWLGKQRNPATRDDRDEFEIRLESDRNAVTIMTIHKSKGLEFPVVFCPFLWDKTALPTRKNDASPTLVYFHDKDGKPIIDLSGNQDNLRNSQYEVLQELMRLAYVAVTRSRYRCYLIGGDFKSRPTSAWAYLFNYRRGLNALGDTRYPEPPEGLDIPAAWLEKGQAFSKEFKYSFTHEEPELSLRRFMGNIDRDWRITSFSGLAPHAAADSIIRDCDQSDEDGMTLRRNTPPEFSNDLSIFNFPAGARTGSCWHEIFEELDFTQGYPAIRKMVETKLDKYGLASGTPNVAKQKYAIVSDMVSNVLNTPLDGFKLADIPVRDRLTEMEFNFMLKKAFSTTGLAALLQDYAREHFGVDGFGDWNILVNGGFMMGFIDMLFRVGNTYYIVDWKSNRLNGNAISFDSDGLRAEMGRHFYFLQYLIYTVALNKFLCSRLGDGYDYERHFGGVYYFFLRGVDPAVPGRGVFYERPPLELVNALEQALGEDK